MPISNGPTLNDIKDPLLKRNKLIARKHHIDTQIKELQDRQYIIITEIARIEKQLARVDKE